MQKDKLCSMVECLQQQIEQFHENRPSFMKTSRYDYEDYIEVKTCCKAAFRNSPQKIVFAFSFSKLGRKGEKNQSHL